MYLEQKSTNFFIFGLFDLMILYIGYVFVVSRDQILHQICVKSNHQRQSYCDFNMRNLGDVRHLGFYRR